MNRARKVRIPKKQINVASGTEFEDAWTVLSSAFKQVFAREHSHLAFESLYRNVFQLVMAKKGQQVYDNVSALVRDWLVDTLLPKILQAASQTKSNSSNSDSSHSALALRKEGERVLQAVKDSFEEHTQSMGLLSDVLMYLDRNFCKQNLLPAIYIQTLAIFRDTILRARVSASQSLSELVIDIILAQIEAERDGDVIDKALIRACLYMYEGLYEDFTESESTKLYLTEFEPAYLERSKTFYHEEGRVLLNTVDACTFCRKVKDRIAEENDRCRSTISALSQQKTQQIINDELIVKCIDEVMDMPSSGLKIMLESDRIAELGMLYELNCRVDNKKERLRAGFQKQISLLGTSINKVARDARENPTEKATVAVSHRDEQEKPVDGKSETERPTGNAQTFAAINWVSDVLRAKSKYDAILSQALNNDHHFQTTISHSFSDFVNDYDRASENVSLFFDENLKKNIKGRTEKEVDQLLDDGILLLRFISDKDLFEVYYKKHLSKRLLMKRSLSMDAERQMISKMKLEVGSAFTQRIESMFKDMAVSEDLAIGYKRQIEKRGEQDAKRVELGINVLTSTIWPVDAFSTVEKHDLDEAAQTIVPAPIEPIRRDFEQFYLAQHSGRKLNWQMNSGTADIRAFFPKSPAKVKTRELNVSTYAMIILLLFNDTESTTGLSCGEIHTKTQIPMSELTRNLQSLSLAKNRILLKTPMSRDVKPTDMFTFNEAFNSQYHKIKIGVIAAGTKSEDLTERKLTEQKTNEERMHVIDAAIVRIMKQRKSSTHIALVNDVISQLNTRFRPDVTLIKKRIESLIERDYIERVESASIASYNYLA